ncbi:LysR family transcriptional regulator [Agromyces albus]|uniref:LysR family transcriptional regulator n=1 Tax=Agromyces albus TaxID=205332 RepID=A0A4Q2L760_9MICO|nr:LysR family transcriptional regulator [Agromyces albus]RXZ72363.1 LysR family transcriptional regulator [Agromyces albus]
MRDLNVLASFVSAVRTGSVSAAARQLGYSASVVSRHLGALERELGISLFERTGRAIQPTMAARVLADRATLLLEEAAQFDRDAAAVALGRDGVVRFGFFRAAATTIVPPSIVEFARERPDARVVTTEFALSEDVVDQLASGEIDLGIVWGFPHPEAAGMETSPLFSEALVLVTAPDRDDLHSDPTNLSRLVREDFSSALGHKGSPPLVDQLFLAQGLPAPTVTHRPPDHAVMRSLIAAGLVIALLPALGVSDPSPGVRRSATAQDFRRTYLAWNPRNANPLRAPLAAAVRAVASETVGFGLTYLDPTGAPRPLESAPRAHALDRTIRSIR